MATATIQSINSQMGIPQWVFPSSEEMEAFYNATPEEQQEMLNSPEAQARRAYWAEVNRLAEAEQAAIDAQEARKARKRAAKANHRRLMGFA